MDVRYSKLKDALLEKGAFFFDPEDVMQDEESAIHEISLTINGQLIDSKDVWPFRDADGNVVVTNDEFLNVVSWADKLIEAHGNGKTEA